MKVLPVVAAALLLVACGRGPGTAQVAPTTSTAVPTCQEVSAETEQTLEISLNQRDDLKQVRSIISSAPIANAGGAPTFIAAQTSDHAIAIWVKLARGPILSVNDEARSRSSLAAAGNITLEFPGAKEAAACSVNASTEATG